jgi:hypothetical protein
MERTRGGLNVMRFYKGIQTKLYRYTASTQPFNITFNSGTAAGYGMGYYSQGSVPAVPGGSGNFLQLGFRLSSILGAFGAGGITTFGNLTNLTEYTNLYEQFKLEAVELDFYYVNAPNVAGSAVPQVPLICTCYDPDDMDNFAFSNMQQAPTFRKIQMGNSSGSPNGKQSLKVQPCFSPRMIVEGGSVVIPDVKSTWLDTASADTANHYGVKIYYDNQDGRAAIQYSGFMTVYVKYHIVFRGSVK